MGVIPNPKMTFIFPISCILVLIFPICMIYFPKCEGKGSFPKSPIKSLGHKESNETKHLGNWISKCITSCSPWELLDSLQLVLEFTQDLPVKQGFFCVFSGAEIQPHYQWNSGDFFPNFEKKIPIFKIFFIFLFFFFEDWDFHYLHKSYMVIIYYHRILLLQFFDGKSMCNIDQKRHNFAQ